MNQESQYKTPGQYIQDLLDTVGWTQRILAIVLGVDETGINKIITGKRQLTADMALAIGELFKVEPERLMELQKSYDLAQARILARPDPERTIRARLFGNLPVPDMIHRGWLKVDDLRDFAKIETELTRFFGVASVEEIEVIPHAAKKASYYGDCNPVQLAWLYRVREIAKEMLVARFSHGAVQNAIAELKPLLASPSATRKVPRILQECGIRFVIVESLPGSKIDGVCFWLDDVSPVIGMSLRYDRIDNFWFILRHELEHVMQLHGKTTVVLDSDLEGERAGTGDSVTEEERIANKAASEFCVPKKSLDSFIARKSPMFRENDLIGFANTLHIHPGIAAGQLQRRVNRYDLFRNHLVKIRASIAPSAMVDGWGDIAPVGL